VDDPGVALVHIRDDDLSLELICPVILVEVQLETDRVLSATDEAHTGVGLSAQVMLSSPSKLSEVDEELH
jgi:hypothetical protein